MNEVFLIGKIVSEVGFDFIINSKYHAISKFKIKTIDGTVLNIKAYDNLADYIYKKMKSKYNVFIYGKLKKDYILVKNIKKL